MDFITFKTFISTEALIVFYYFGAIIMPVGLWFLLAWRVRKYGFLNAAYASGKEKAWKLLNKKQRTGFLVFFGVSFLFMELFWRMLFEFLIAYMQMRDALLQAPL